MMILMRSIRNFLLFVILAGCVALPHPETAAPAPAPKAPPGFPARIAVFPLVNNSGNPDGGLIMRAFVIKKLGRELGFVVQSPTDTDGIIRDRTLSGPEIPVQVAIAGMDTGTLTTWLGVDGILHGELLAYERAHLSVYVRSKVEVKFWLTDSHGKTIWESRKNSEDGSFGGGGSMSLDSELADSQIPADVMSRIHDSDLAPVALEVVDDAFSTFPRGY